VVVFKLIGRPSFVEVSPVRKLGTVVGSLRDFAQGSQLVILEPEKQGTASLCDSPRCSGVLPVA
jgi:hypothetical protein